jgi:sterol desaturase/sphingolipid hydroxylase (fatty acid hydroxylase superfamily)
MNGFMSFGLMIGVGILLYLTIVYWPHRIPHDRSVDEIPSRIEEEDQL